MRVNERSVKRHTFGRAEIDRTAGNIRVGAVIAQRLGIKFGAVVGDTTPLDGKDPVMAGHNRIQ